MHTRVDEVADGVYRISTHLPGPPGCGGTPTPPGMSVNQFLVLAEEPLLFHTGMRATFPATAAAIERVLPLRALRWVSFGHVEADECGALGPLLAAAPHARVAYGEASWPGTIEDMAGCDERRPIHRLVPGDRLDIGGRRLLHLATPHAPHNAEAQVLFEETTGTLLSGDLFAQAGSGPPVTVRDLVDDAVVSEERFPMASPGPAVPHALRRLATLRPLTIAPMHGSAFEGDGAAALVRLADAWGERFAAPAQVAAVRQLPSPHG
jgi:flavorubredoxin